MDDQSRSIIRNVKGPGTCFLFPSSSFEGGSRFGGVDRGGWERMARGRRGRRGGGEERVIIGGRLGGWFRGNMDSGENRRLMFG